MTTPELQTALREGDTTRLFLFCGEEEYLKRHYLGLLREHCLPDPTFAVFNHLRHSGERIDFDALAEEIRTPPMFSESKLIEWHLAAFSSLRDKELLATAEQLRALRELLAESPGCCVVFVAGAQEFDPGQLPRRPSALYRALSGILDIVVFSEATEAQLLSWANRHLLHEQIRADGDSLRLLLARCGHKMEELSHEIDKLTAYLHENRRDTLTPEDIRFVCVHNTEDDAFGLSNALLAGNAAAACDSLFDMKRRRVDPAVILGSISRLYGQLVAVRALADEGASPADIESALHLHSYTARLYLRAARQQSAEALRHVLTRCCELDLESKSGGGSAYTGIELLIAELLCPAPPSGS